MEEILVPTHKDWRDKANTPDMKLNVYYRLKYLSLILHVSYIYKVQTHVV